MGYLIIVGLHSGRQHLCLGKAHVNLLVKISREFGRFFLRRSPAGWGVLQATEEAALARRAAMTVPQEGE